MSERNKGGRPSIYSQEIADAICEAIAGGKSLRQVCAQDDMPSTATVIRWTQEKPEFRERYARAREAMGDYYFDLIVEAAGDVTPENAQAVRAKVDALKWVCARLRPAAYCEKVAVAAEITGRVEIEAPQQTQLEAARAVAFALEMARHNSPAPDPILIEATAEDCNVKPH